MKSTIYLVYMMGVIADALSGKALFERSDSPALDALAQLVGKIPCDQKDMVNVNIRFSN
jgi:hypothetical protein